MRFMLLRPVTLALFAAVLPTQAGAQARGRDTVVVRVTGGAIDSAFRSIASVQPNARDLPTGALGSYGLIVLARRTTDAAELHERWTDVVFVRSGTAVLRTGRTLVRRQRGDPGEWNGAGITGVRDQAVGPGDVVVIPAGIAHQWRPNGAQAFSYVLLKVRPGGRAGP